VSGIKKRTAEDRERITRAARRLRDQGLSYNAIGRALGVSNMSIREWLNPELARKRKQANGVGVKIHQNVGASKPEPKTEIGRAKDMIRQVIELKARGYGNQAIAAQLRIPYRQVEEALR
jgi:orotate phosphoribosyltransferase-like protein